MTYSYIVIKRFAMLHVFYKQLRLGDSTEVVYDLA